MNFAFLLQVDPNMAADAIGIKEVPLWDIIAESNKGVGWVINLALLLMLGYVVFVFVERYLALRRASKEETNFLSKIKHFLIEGKISEAKEFCEKSESPSARMLEKGIARLGKPIESISASIENAAKLEVMRLEQRTSFLATAAGAAPMIGFLGTTVGMVVVFIDLQNSATLELQVIAPGILTAMITTVSGLIVGIISFMGYNYLVGRIAKVVYKMENAALEFMDLLNQPGK